MEPESRHTLIGAVVLALLLGLAFAVVWLSRSGAASDFQYYTIKFERQSLEGLQIGGDVNMRGIKVGRVESFSLERDNINRVSVLIRVQRATPVSNNTGAVVARNLVTGIARINLDTPGVPGPALVEIPPGEPYPVIAEGTSDLDQITESANRLVLTAETALASINSLLTPENRQAFGDSMVALRSLSTGLAARLGQIDSATTGLDATLQELQRTSRRVGTAADMLTAQFGPLGSQAQGLLTEGTQAMRQLGAVAQAGNAALVDAHAAVRGIGDAAVSMGATTRRVADEGLGELTLTAREMRAAAAMLARAAERLAEPRSAVLGPGPRELGPGEVVK